MKIAVLEPGAWGTSLGILLSQDNKVSFWYENKELALKLSEKRENERLPGIKIPKKIFILSNLEKIISDTDLIIIASPSFNFRKTLLKLKKCRARSSVNFPPLLGIAKGIEKETLKLPSQIVEEIFGKILYAHLSGPGFAREIIRGKSAEEVIASQNRSLLKKLKELFKIKHRARRSRAKVKKKEPSSLLKIFTTTDLIGVQLAGALKNALAIGISLVEAKIQNPKIGKLRENLIQLGLKEMIKIGKVLGAKRKTFLGPAGLGDLILTSTSSLSRNFQFGQAILLDAQKMRKEIRERKITVEGFDNVFALYKLGKIYKLDLPMINEIYKVIYQKVSPPKIVQNLIKLTEKA
jgi:glycerol-3-phosphate dehydrogenase (NAD(P)+)